MKTLDGPTVKHILSMLDPFPLQDLASYRTSTKGTRGLYVLSYAPEKKQKPVPVYVGMGIDIFERLKNHIGAILAGDFCLWDVEDEALKDCIGLACEHKEKGSSVLYIPGTKLAAGYKSLPDRARIFLERTHVVVLKAEPAVDEELLYRFEGSLIRFLAGENRSRATNEGRCLLANGDRSSKAPLAFRIKSEGGNLSEYLTDYLHSFKQVE